MQEDFLHFYRKRVRRIYLPYLLFLPCLILSGTARGWSWSELLFPVTAYHFLPTILLLYPLFYLCVRLQRRSIPFFAPALAVGCFQLGYFLLGYDGSYPVYADFHLLPICSYFMVMLLGAQKRAAPGGLFPRPVYLTGAAVAFFAYVLIQFKPLPESVSILQLYIGVLFACSTGALLLSLEDKLPSWRLASQIADTTLEIYLVQGAAISAFASVPFPVNLLYCGISILAFAEALHRLTAWVTRWCQR